MVSQSSPDKIEDLPSISSVSAKGDIRPEGTLVIRCPTPSEIPLHHDLLPQRRQQDHAFIRPFDKLQWSQSGIGTIRYGLILPGSGYLPKVAFSLAWCPRSDFEDWFLPGYLHLYPGIGLSEWQRINKGDSGPIDHVTAKGRPGEKVDVHLSAPRSTSGVKPRPFGDHRYTYDAIDGHARIGSFIVSRPDMLDPAGTIQSDPNWLTSLSVSRGPAQRKITDSIQEGHMVVKAPEHREWREGSHLQVHFGVSQMEAELESTPKWVVEDETYIEGMTGAEERCERLFRIPLGDVSLLVNMSVLPGEPQSDFHWDTRPAKKVLTFGTSC